MAHFSFGGGRYPALEPSGVHEVCSGSGQSAGAINHRPNPNAHGAGGVGVATCELFYGRETPSGDLALYRACADRFGAPILELGTGTGRVAAALCL